MIYNRKIHNCPEHIQNTRQSMRRASVEFLFKAAGKYSYSIILKEFEHVNDRGEFVYYARNLVVPNTWRRDVNKCEAIKKCLNSKDEHFKSIALIILRSYVNTWSDDILSVVNNLSTTDSDLVKYEVKLCQYKYKTMTITTS